LTSRIVLTQFVVGRSIWALWRAKPGNVVVPGRDLPMQLRGDEPVYLGRWRAAIKAWFQQGIDQMTEISLTEPAGLDRVP
jgi:N-acyl homoserine lactone hydrolase